MPTQNRRTLIPFRSMLRLLAILLPMIAAPTFAEHRVGVGVHYWETVDDVVEGPVDVAEDGLAFVVSYQWAPKQPLLRFELDLEIFDNGFGGSDESAVAPVAFLIVGSKLYVGIGAGVTISDGLENDVSDLFFAGRVGYQLKLLPGLALDLNVNYRTNAFDALDEFETDTVTFGALVRVKL